MTRRIRSIFIAALALFFTSCSDDGSITLQGAGATFPAPLYKRWFLEYYQRHHDVRINYQAIGSGAGIRQFIAGMVNFAASDAAMSDGEIKQLEQNDNELRHKGKSGVAMLPMTAGNIALAYNLPDIHGTVRLSRKAMVDIFLGKIKFWDHADIVKDNPQLTLPHQEMTVVRRSEGSGTTFAFTNHLSAISPEWKSEIGASKTVDKWKTGIGARGNNGVAATIKQTPGAIGYIEAGYAELTHLPMAAIENKKGNFLEPTTENGMAALADAKLPDNLRLFITDPQSADAYPIVTFTWLLCYKSYRDERTAETIKSVVVFCLTKGQEWSKELGYVPLPKTVVERVLAATEEIRVGD
jgi:phosphate transport system substrate-binding protein